MLGRPVSELVCTYKQEIKKKLCDLTHQKVCDAVHVSLVSGLTLAEYITARKEHCSTAHTTACSKCLCARFLQVASIILEKGFYSLSSAFAVISPDVAYTAERARSKLLQLPVVSVRIGTPSEGRSYTVLIEKFPGVDYRKMGLILNGMAPPLSRSKCDKKVLEKSAVKLLLDLAQSDRERKCMQ